MDKDTYPERLSEILGRLFIARGWGRTGERQRLEEAWRIAAGTPVADKTQLGRFKQGVLEVLVANAVLLQELVHFRKRSLLEGMKQQLPGFPLKDLRFRAGVISKPDRPGNERH